MTDNDEGRRLREALELQIRACKAHKFGDYEGSAAHLIEIARTALARAALAPPATPPDLYEAGAAEQEAGDRWEEREERAREWRERR